MIIYCCNDGAVMDSWGHNIGAEGTHVKLFADTTSSFTEAMGMLNNHPDVVWV